MPNLRRGVLREMISYAVVGGVSFLLDFGVLVLLTEWGRLHYLLSATISFCLGLACNYTLSILWVFQERSLARRVVEVSIFSLIGLVGLALNAGVMWSFTEGMLMPYQLSKILATMLIFLWNFSARKLILFTARVKT